MLDTSIPSIVMIVVGLKLSPKNGKMEIKKRKGNDMLSIGGGIVLARLSLSEMWKLQCCSKFRTRLPTHNGTTTSKGITTDDLSGILKRRSQEEVQAETLSAV